MAFPRTVVSLPSDDLFNGQPSLQQAYERLRTYETTHSTKPLPARWLGHLLREVPVKDALAREITSCKDDTAIQDLSDIYRDLLLRLFKPQEGPTPDPSDPSSRPSDVIVTNAILHDRVPQDHGAAKCLALKRDGGRSISGQYDISIEDIPKGSTCTWTNAAHIIPFVVNSNRDQEKNTGKGKETDPNLNWSAGVLAVLSRIGGIVPEEIRGEKINRLSNIITMNAEHHIAFDRLAWWLEPANSGEPNHYVVRRIRPNLSLLPVEIRFTSTDPWLELPDPKFIAIHAACCRAAHLSAAVEAIDKIYDAFNETRVLADNGSSAELLEFSLSKLVVSAS
ncbi:uncharacterized protein EI90DRAFT_3055831 [Cantharellus anzutake]|uniref:uncharacterized protein n=1 Tax=Cantharellus anzutake TaxID=1750568 RepID=UPI001902D4FE|nr:uncharacterized protein EI90DRAFT_3055831 [Cantharellus anzutake]KAF8331903.1 hypothetical protein EI90DRAFT_3055831 [Cantharellus anzutake]